MFVPVFHDPVVTVVCGAIAHNKYAMIEAA